MIQIKHIASFQKSNAFYLKRCIFLFSKPFSLNIHKSTKTENSPLFTIAHSSSPIIHHRTFFIFIGYVHPRLEKVSTLDHDILNHECEKRTKWLLEDELYCNHCKAKENHPVIKQMRHWLYLFFIPIMPLRKSYLQYECSQCENLLLIKNIEKKYIAK